MTDAEKLTKIEHYRKMLEQSLLAAYGVDADVTVHMHEPTFEQYATACAFGWRVRQNIGATMAVSSPTKPGSIGETVLFYNPNKNH